MGTEQPTQQAPWGAGGRGCLLVLLSRVPYAVRCHATRLRRGSPSGRHRGRAGSDGVASHKAGFRSRRFPAPACSGITLPLAVPRSSQRAVPATPGCETFVSRLPSGSKRTENPGPWVLARGSLGACAAVAGQSALFGFPSAFVTAAVDPVTPPLGLPDPGLALPAARLLGLHSPSLPSSPAGALRTQALVRRFVVASAASFLLGGLARSRHFKYHL